MSKKRTEWAVEVTWADWKAAGAEGPTSQYGPFAEVNHRDSFVNHCRLDRGKTQVRVLTREAIYTPWVPDGDPITTNEKQRGELFDAYVGALRQEQMEEAES